MLLLNDQGRSLKLVALVRFDVFSFHFIHIVLGSNRYFHLDLLTNFSLEIMFTSL